MKRDWIVVIGIPALMLGIWILFINFVNTDIRDFVCVMLAGWYVGTKIGDTGIWLARKFRLID